MRKIGEKKRKYFQIKFSKVYSHLNRGWEREGRKKLKIKQQHYMAINNRSLTMQREEC